MKKFILFTVALSFTFCLHAQIIYVTTGGSGLKDGSSWANALDGNSPYGNGFTKLAQATQTELSGKQFWIAEGTYKAATDDNRGRYFMIREGVSFYGGFTGMETSIEQRAIMQHKAILSGDIGIANDISDNAYHVLATDQSGTIFNNIPIIDGISICAGNASNTSSAFNNCGGAVYLFYGKDAVIRNCIISNNNSVWGGAIFTRNKVTVENSIIVNNGKAAIGGYDSNVITVSNSTIVNNEMGIYFGINSNVIDNCIIWGNASPFYAPGANATITVHNSCIQEGIYGGINADPKFINPSLVAGISNDGINDDWNLSPSSPCINAGENTNIPYNNFVDCANKKRISESIVDIGALEFNSTIYQTLTPRIPSSNPIVSLINDSKVRISWTRGNGLICKVWMARADQVENTPKTNGKDFTASSSFGSGDFVTENGMVWFCVYKGTSDKVDITDLSPGTNYKVCIIESFTDDLAQIPSIISFTTSGIPSPKSTIYFVKNGGGINGHDGKSWETAFNSPLPAISLAKTTNEIWIAGGTYFPSQTNNRYESFLLTEGINIYGGFAGNETTLKQRIANKNETILSGNIGSATDSLDNSYHVIYSIASATSWKDTVLIDNITIKEGVANGTGENIRGGGIFLNTNCNLKLKSCKIVSNSGIGKGNPGGGAILNKGILRMENSEVTNNRAVYMGGGIFNENYLSLKNCLISNNKITFPAGSSFIETWGGGGIYNFLNAKLTIDSCEIKNNTTQNNLHGGGIYSKGKTFINHSLVENNFSARDGGGIYSTGPMKILNSHFTKNQSAFYGGAISSTDSLVIDRSYFGYNIGVAVPTISSSGYLMVTNSELCHGIHTGQAGNAGAIRSSGKTKIINCDIHSSNTKGFEYYSTGGMFDIAVCFTGSDGGGILHTADSLFIDNCKIYNNLASGGGAVAIRGGFASIKNTFLTNNLAADGAAIMNMGKTSVVNCLITNNSGFRGGIILNVDNGFYQITNSSIANNLLLSLDNDNAIFKHGMFDKYTSNTINISNSIIKSASKIVGYYPGSTGSENISYSCITGGFTGIGNINADPIFVNPTAGNDTTYNALLADWKLSVNSPCINTGNDALCNDLLDLGNNPRKLGRIDMGAYEFKNNNTSFAIQHEKTEGNISIYPNPVTNELNIELIDNTKKIDFNIVNSTGQVVSRGHLIDKTKVQTSQLAPGFYLLKFENGNALESKKFIKE